MPMAVRWAPGMAWARYPRDSIFWQTARTCSSVACARMTTNMVDLGTNKSIVRARRRQTPHCSRGFSFENRDSPRREWTISLSVVLPAVFRRLANVD